MDSANKRLNFVQNTLPKLIAENSEDFKNKKIVNCVAVAKTEVDGFMSSIYFVDLTLQDKEGRQELHNIVVKTMKGDESFREKTHSKVQFSNEIYIYLNVIPFFKNYLKDIPLSTFNPDSWVPRIYFADYGVFEELGDDKETILALENLTPRGYRLGPQLDLDEAHLTMMIKHIASYHAVSYAIRITDNRKFVELTSGLIPLSFLTPEGRELESYGILYKYSLERFFYLTENRKEFYENAEFMRLAGRFKSLYYKNPLKLMESFLRKDDDFPVILHGDYYRNNVLFRYESNEENPLEMRMFDFQETRFATPAIDLSIYMYINLPPGLRRKIWDKLLEAYHETLVSSLTDILKCDKDDERLAPYAFDKFLEHFSKYACYGLMIGIHSTPWHACSEEECKQISHYFENDMKSEEFRKLTQVCGGKEVDDRIVDITLHAFEKGYMKIFN